MKSKIISIIGTLLFGFVYFYIALPALNIHTYEFWFFITLLIVCYLVLANLTMVKGLVTGKITSTRVLKQNKAFLIIPAIYIIIFVLEFFGGPLFNAKKYATRIEINESSSFTEDVAKVDFTKLPLLDKDSSMQLGDRVMGQMSDLVSQFNVSAIYTQINYNGKIVRVTPLEYASFIKWITNRVDGVQGYITVDSTNGESKLTRLETGMKYVESGYFNDNLYRKLRFAYPCDSFGRISFEIDEEGHPYWIVPVIKYKLIELRREISHIIILDPITGESRKIKVEEVPSWVDMVYSADLIIEQVDDWGTYNKGYFNSILGQKNVVNTTEGYNYLAMNDDIYLYTGITSIVADESNLGFILTNMRTKETVFYKVPGAEEYSAMASAEGAVQHLGYKSTFPLLINLNNKPTYLVSLKDDAGLVKMYGFVDVTDYQKVVVTDSSKGIQAAAHNYLGDEKYELPSDELTTKEIVIKRITSATVSGNTYYYIVDNHNKKYKVSISVSDNLPFLTSGQKIKIGYALEENITVINKIY